MLICVTAPLLQPESTDRFVPALLNVQNASDLDASNRFQINLKYVEVYSHQKPAELCSMWHLDMNQEFNAVRLWWIKRQFFLQGLGCFLAWNIRSAQVDHPALGSKPLTLSVFAVAAFTVAGVAGSLLTSHSRPVHFCLSSVLILCCSIFILSCMFGPKVSVSLSALQSVQVDVSDIMCFKMCL